MSQQGEYKVLRNLDIDKSLENGVKLRRTLSLVSNFAVDFRKFLSCNSQSVTRTRDACILRMPASVIQISIRVGG